MLFRIKTNDIKNKNKLHFDRNTQYVLLYYTYKNKHYINCSLRNLAI
jgi:hypothetical protein